MTDDEPDDEPTPNGSRVIGLRGLRRNISREEAAQFIATASLKVGEKVYDEISKEHARVFAEMEQRLNAKFEERFAQQEAKIQRLAKLTGWDVDGSLECFPDEPEQSTTAAPRSGPAV